MTPMGAFPRPGTRRAAAALLACVVALATLAGCGSGGSAEPPPEPSLPEQAPGPAERCGFAGTAEKVVLTTADGVKLSGARVGEGAHGVVLLPQRDADMCGWSSAVSRMVGAGLHVLAIDLRCAGYSDCDNSSDDQLDNSHDFAADAAAAIAELKRAGASKVVVMGASLGAASAVVAGGRFADQVSGVVGLSVFKAGFNASGSASTSVTTPENAAPHITAPMLLVVATGDGSCISPGAAQDLIDKSAATAKGKVIVRDGSAHGWDLLRSPDIDAEVLDFLKANS
jgi:pimeloyl-ACP methyl ester carboxylesterase